MDLSISVFFEGAFPYWNNGTFGKRRSGTDWTPELIADDSGMPIDDVRMFIAWMKEPGQAGLRNQELADKFAAGFVIVRTGFIGGDYIESADILHKALGTVSTIGVKPEDAFWAQMKQVIISGGK